ncbi:MAG: bifunctional demethylmenaquinone methyltransferase/2-methoxy-6-polyprenyl-1,4-benzoquinol methylase UbiE [Burkholderiales bacterium]|jgi:demethylmenaquinone methyltransferase/2-methoxy-6-polyprenyl-1,4-benzoquinol methylase|nr:bifunctional demethylmenaquinone methyltransferase/2-methoxy-6-polyprenyl-1,4-benzoquinol methylase UbiE [Burkholderiales bacterium]
MKKTHFGFETIDAAQKEKRVADVFDSIAAHYDLMNDLASFGLHRRWKRNMVDRLAVHEEADILDLAGGTGDLTRLFLEKCPRATVILSDINATMLRLGRAKLIRQNFSPLVLQCNAEALPFADQTFDAVSIGFGLRNITDKEKTLAEMRRVLRPGGIAAILEFSRVAGFLAPFYDFYSFTVLPKLGALISGDQASYRYLAESIRVHPDQEKLRKMMLHAGFDEAEYYNMTFGIVAVHVGYVH